MGGGAKDSGATGGGTTGGGAMGGGATGGGATDGGATGGGATGGGVMGGGATAARCLRERRPNSTSCAPAKNGGAGRDGERGSGCAGVSRGADIKHDAGRAGARGGGAAHGTQGRSAHGELAVPTDGGTACPTAARHGESKPEPCQPLGRQGGQASGCFCAAAREEEPALEHVGKTLQLAQVRRGLPGVAESFTSMPNTQVLLLPADSATSACRDQLVGTLQQLPLRGLCTAGQIAQKREKRSSPEFGISCRDGQGPPRWLWNGCG